MSGFVVAFKRQIVHIATLWLFAGVTFAYDFAGGTGEPNDPYQIATAAQLVSIGADPNLLDKHFVLLNDIDLDPNLPGGRVFTQGVIAPNLMGSFSGVCFQGEFDGSSHAIRNLTAHGRRAYAGLFGEVGPKGMVHDLRIEGADVGGEWIGAGALAGVNDGRIIRCHAAASVSGASHVGVLVGINDGDIIECWARGDVAGAANIGGLVGHNAEGAVVNSYATSRVITTRSFADGASGGLVGFNDISGVILNCHAAGDVSAMEGGYHGGLVGRNYGGGIIAHSYATGNVWVETTSAKLGGLTGGMDGGWICDCYATGDVSGGYLLGGLVGSAAGRLLNCYATGRLTPGDSIPNPRGGNSGMIIPQLGGLVGSNTLGAEIENCLWDVETSGTTESAGGNGLTTAQMQEFETFLEAGWDWVGEQTNGMLDLWLIPEGGGYPVLTVHSDSFVPHELKGSGTVDDPYRIATTEDLCAINHHDLAACYSLDADIDLSGIVWKWALVPFLGGRFDGAGRNVSHLQVQGDILLGLFGLLGRNASVVNLGVQDANIAGGSDLGILAGRNRGHVTRCRASGVVNGTGSLGGLVGRNEGNIRDSYITGDVTADVSWAVGGLIGWNLGTIDGCYAGAHVTWSRWGWTTWVWDYEKHPPGGLVGLNELFGRMSEIHQSYFLIDADAGGPDNGLGVPLTDVQMKQPASFVNWDFENTWTICEGKDYPRLAWEHVSCGP